MIYKTLREQVLKLLNQYTVAGTEVADSYNNQIDYVNRIPALANDAIMYIATTVRKIQTVAMLSDFSYEDLGKFVRYELPPDFYQLKSGDTIRLDDGRVLHTNVYMIQGRKYLVLPKQENEDIMVTYYRYPALLDDVPDDFDVLDNTPETHTAVPYYVASLLAAPDDAHLSALLMDIYQDRVNSLTPEITAEVHPVDDVYGFGAGLIS